MLSLTYLAPATLPHPKSSAHCNAMDPSPTHVRSESPAERAAADPEELDPTEFRLQVDFFRKLGYSRQEVRVALHKLGLNADTNAVLGELIQNQADAEQDPIPSPNFSPVLVPWASGLNPTTTCQGEEPGEDSSSLKPIVIDGSNVAMSHGNKEVFSCQGIQLAVNYFLERGHTDITVFVPSWRKEQPRPDVPITDQHILRDLERKKIVVFTPSRRVGGKRVVCYDDRFIVKLAYESGGIIVSNDTYRDLQSERPEWKRCVEEQLLMYSFVNDKFMPPDDPLGRHGPSLENFLRKKPLVPEHKRQPCPYGKKCTYGIKCKFLHPERLHQSQRSVADELRANAKLSSSRDDKRTSRQKKPGHGDSALLSLEQEMERSLSLQQRGSHKGCQVSENVLLQRERGSHHGRRAASRKGQVPASSDCSHLSGSSQECLDSGLGSYESQSSSCSCSSSSSCSPHRYVHSSHAPDSQDGHQPCSCCTHLAPPSCPQHYGQSPAPCQSCYPAAPLFGRPLYPAPIQHHYSLPAGFPQILPSPQKYWTEPFHSVPPSHAARSLPDHNRMAPPPEQGMMGIYGGDHRHWPPPPGPPQAPYQAEREDVRKKLQAIFHPCQVDKVMGMFPHVLDPQALAAEILTLKSHGGAL
ncbi:hypothetical protein GJAV_G00009760 [Gymnothorax javanicus]|nr:hypothetical protein GJAV_G00009760 [Gymnothorax javanicus]